MISIRDLIEKTTSQSEQQREVRQAERTNLSQMRDAAFEVVTTEPELYQKYLTLQADNIRCSAGNVALTLIQLPDASKIGSIDYWHSVGRYVQDGAMQNGAKVFVPPRSKNARGYFMGVYYDISQTTGRPLEGQTVIPEGSPKLIAALEPLMQGARAALKEDNTLEQSAYYDPNTLTILVNTEHPAHDVFAALAVESVHARMHNQGRNTQYNREAYQIDAESIGYMVCRRFGVPCKLPDANELAASFDGCDPAMRGTYLEEQRQTAKSIGDSIDRTINPKQQEQRRGRPAYTR